MLPILKGVLSFYNRLLITFITSLIHPTFQINISFFLFLSIAPLFISFLPLITCFFPLFVSFVSVLRYSFLPLPFPYLFVVFILQSFFLWLSLLLYLSLVFTVPFLLFWSFLCFRCYSSLFILSLFSCSMQFWLVICPNSVHF
jgi:hypothetical protein